MSTFGGLLGAGGGMQAQIQRDPRVRRVYKEDDGGGPSWWVELMPGYICPSMQCGIIHEKRLADAAKLLKTVRKEEEL